MVKLNKQEFTLFAKTFATKMADFELNELFSYLLAKRDKENNDHNYDKLLVKDDKLEI